MQKCGVAATNAAGFLPYDRHSGALLMNETHFDVSLQGQPLSF